MSDLVNITIDGHQLSVPKGTLLVEAAREVGIEIPVYCYHPKMKPVGACRVCVVEVENQRRPIMTACTTTVMPDMVVHTKSENAIAAREGILEFLLINHPLDCPVCDRAGECDLQDFTLRYGPPTTRFVEQKRHFDKSKQVGQNVILDRERCIMCQRCVRFCDEIAMDEGLVIIERGNRSEIGTFEGRSFDSQYSGNTIELCPVGALTAKTYRFNARPWEQQHFAGVCTGCSVGCNLTVDIRFDEVVRFRSRVNDRIDDGWLCDRGRYGHIAVHRDRLLKPMGRNTNGDLEEISWERAIELASTKLSEDGTQPAVLLGGGLSLEDGHMLLRLARGVLETSHISHQYQGETPPLEMEHQAAGQVFGCDDAEMIVCLGCNPAETHPVLDLRIKKGLRRGAKLVVLNSEPVLDGLADYRAVGEPTELWAKLLKDLKRRRKSKKGLAIPAPRPWEAGGSTNEDWKSLVGEFVGKERVLVVVAGDLSAQGLTEVTDSVAEKDWNTTPHGVLHLRSGANALGLELVGCRPDAGPGGSALKKTEAYADCWGSFNSVEGQAYLDSVKEPKGKVALAVGCDPLAVDGAKKPDYLIVCATHQNSSTEKADLVLPLSTWLESHGTYVSTDGTLQFSRQSLLPQGESVPAWALAERLIASLDGEGTGLTTPRQIFAELGRLNPAFSGRSYRDFQTPTRAHWSYPQQADLGMPRPDLSAIPVAEPDTPMWKPTPNTGSKVENSARLLRGETPPQAPGQRDPREIAALLGLANPSVPNEVVKEVAPAKEGYVPLRVVEVSAARPPGPTPSERYHQLGMGRHSQVALPVSEAVALLEAEVEEEPQESEAEEEVKESEVAEDAVEESKAEDEADEADDESGDEEETD